MSIFFGIMMMILIFFMLKHYLVVDLNFIHVTQLSSKLPFYECESIIIMSPKNVPKHIESATTC